ncbi:hypothetical protein Bbelb_438730 [Branchiostoma belcheri]|nr:hypothetical protein Bbelb_438730 [Branchiostoma belcheri]
MSSLPCPVHVAVYQAQAGATAHTSCNSTHKVLLQVYLQHDYSYTNLSCACSSQAGDKHPESGSELSVAPVDQSQSGEGPLIQSRNHKDVQYPCKTVKARARITRRTVQITFVKEDFKEGTVLSVILCRQQEQHDGL